LKSELEEDPFEDECSIKVNINDKKKKPQRDDESDEDEREDREYNWKVSRK
jgi:hypothetical protein